MSLTRIQLYGQSDDLIEIGADEEFEFIPTDDSDQDETTTRSEEINDVRGGPHEIAIQAGDDEMLVTAFYAGDGVWSFAPSITTEGDKFPAWPLSFGIHPQTDYSMLLEIHVETEDGKMVRVIDRGNAS